jgi:acyl-homoserine lactone acylase PvdQ
MRAKSVPELLNLFKENAGTVFNFVMADEEGNIGFASPGAIPKRNHPFEGSAGVKDGASGKDEWDGY